MHQVSLKAGSMMICWLVILKKTITHFGNCGKTKFRQNALMLILLSIGGKCDDQSIANVFADYYNNSVSNNCTDNNSYIFDVSSENLDDWLFGTDDIDILLSMVKRLVWMVSPLNI